MEPNLRGNRDLGLAMKQAELDLFERDLVRRSLAESLRKGSGCEIEQVVRTPGELARRIRSNVHLSYDFDGRFAAGRLSLERDGEPVMDWGWTTIDERAGIDAGEEGDDGMLVEARNALTAVMLHAAAIQQHVGGMAASPDVAECCARIVADSRRIWALFSWSPTRSS